jgi:hypothetical protein
VAGLTFEDKKFLFLRFPHQFAVPLHSLSESDAVLKTECKIKTNNIMKSRKKLFLYFLFLPIIPTSCPAQFNTIQKQPQVVKSKPISDVQADTVVPIVDNHQEFFDLPNHREIAIEYDIPLFVSVKDSMMMELLNRRTSVALPLDFIHVTSDYGYRRDPITRVKERFHNGIDLRCAKGSLVYAMMPGVIEKVVYSETGYGHHVIINHIGLRILYGHLGIIAVKEGDVVAPGTIVALSSDTGRSTGPHLHIRAEKLIGNEWKSVDPEPFIKHLNDYIAGLQEEMANLRFESRPDKPLNLHNLFKVMEECGVLYPKIVAAQYCLETGYGTSNVCRKYNNLFGLFDSKHHDYYRFRSWEESVAGYVRMIQRRYNPKKDKDYYAFLKRIGYAENIDSYNAKVRAIANTL